MRNRFNSRWMAATAAAAGIAVAGISAAPAAADCSPGTAGNPAYCTSTPVVHGNSVTVPGPTKVGTSTTIPLTIKGTKTSLVLTRTKHGYTASFTTPPKPGTYVIHIQVIQRGRVVTKTITIHVKKHKKK